MKVFKIADRIIDLGQPVYVIAEIGINHEGNVDTCRAMIDAAIDAGADAVKLQSIDVDASYTQVSESYHLFKQAALSWQQTAEIFEYAKSRKIHIFTTTADIRSVEKIEQMNPVAYKISSGLMNHYPLISHIAAKQKPIILSTGMSDLNQINEVVRLIEQQGNTNLCILQCTSLYPCPLDKLELSNIAWYRSIFGYQAGFSDHSEGIDAAQLAVAAGAVVIEKHFTLDSSRAGFDHHISLQANEFKAMVKAIRKVALAMGVAGKIQTHEVLQARQKFQRFIVAGRRLKTGDAITEDDLAFKRTQARSDAYQPRDYNKLIGKKLLHDINKDQIISEQDVCD